MLYMFINPRTSKFHCFCVSPCRKVTQKYMNGYIIRYVMKTYLQNLHDLDVIRIMALPPMLTHALGLRKYLMHKNQVKELCVSMFGSNRVLCKEHTDISLSLEISDIRNQQKKKKIAGVPYIVLIPLKISLICSVFFMYQIFHDHWSLTIGFLLLPIFWNLCIKSDIWWVVKYLKNLAFLPVQLSSNQAHKNDAMQPILLWNYLCIMDCLVG